MANSIAEVKKRNSRKNRTLPGSKKKMANKEIANPQILAAIRTALIECGAELSKFARDCYADSGERGVINITAEDHPDNPYKRGGMYFLTESDNDRILARQGQLTDLRIAEMIRTYNPKYEAVVLVWHRLKYHVTLVTDTAAEWEALRGTTNYPFRVH